MMRPLFLILMLLASPLLANEYRLSSVHFKTDKSLGTFVDNGTTYGLVTGVSYAVLVSTGNSSNFVRYAGEFSFQNPRSDFPNVNQLRGLIIADINSSGARQKMDAQLAAQIARDQQGSQKQTFFSDYIYNPSASTDTFIVEGSIVTPN